MIKLCHDQEFINRFMLLPEIYRYAAEYGADKMAVNFPPGDRSAYLSYTVCNHRIGLIDLQVKTGAMCEFHPYILRAHKDKYDEMIKAFFSWFVSNMQEEAVKLNAVIADCFTGALAAAERAGMKLEGVDRASYRAECGVHDRLMYGITREEMKNG